MNWLITGGCGFIGLNLIRTLLKHSNNRIRIIDNFSSGEKEDLLKVSEFCEFKENNIPEFSEHVQLIEGDVADRDLAIKITRGSDILVHLAANTGVQPSIEDPIKDFTDNVIGISSYLEAARINKIKKFIFSSSSAVVGEKIPPINEKMYTNPLSPYGASKLSGEAYCSAYFKSFGLETIVLRFGNVYGPGSLKKGSVIAKFIRKIINGEEIEVYGDGNQTRDFIYVDDLVDAIIICSEKNKIGGELFQIANNHEVKINQIIDEIKSTFASKNINNIKIKYCKPQLGDIKKIYSDTSKANNVLNWIPKIVLTEGINRTIESFLKNE